MGYRLARRTREITTDALVSDHRRPRRFPDRSVDRPGAGDRLETLADGDTLLRGRRQVREMVDRWPMGLTGSDNAHPWRPQRPPNPQLSRSEIRGIIRRNRALLRCFGYRCRSVSRFHASRAQMPAERNMEKTLEGTGPLKNSSAAVSDRDGQWRAEIRSGGCPGRDVVGALCIMDAIVFPLAALYRDRSDTANYRYGRCRLSVRTGRVGVRDPRM